MGFSVSNVLTPHLVEDIKMGNYARACFRFRKACERTAIITYPLLPFVSGMQSL